MYKTSTTIDDIFRLALPQGTQQLAGEQYLARAVTWACTLRPSPPAFPKLDGNELALIDMDDLRRLDPQMRLDRVVFSLQSARISAIAVLGKVDKNAIAAAQSTNLALFQLPEGASPVQVERAVIRLIVDRAGYIAQRSSDLQRELNQVALVGGGLQRIVEYVHQFSQQPVLVLREDGTVSADAGLTDLSPARRESLLAALPTPRQMRTYAAQGATLVPAGAAELSAPLFHGVNGGATHLDEPPTSTSGAVIIPLEQARDFRAAVVAPIVASEAVRGYCLLLRATVSALGTLEDEPSVVEEIAVSQCVAAAALEWAKQNAVDVASERMRAAFVDELLAAEVADEQAWIQRGASLGFDLHKPHAAWIVEARGIPEWPAPLVRFISERNLHVPMSRREEGMLLFWPASDPKSARDHKNTAAELIARLITSYPRARIQIGIGRPATTPATWFQTLQQARESWRLGKEFKGAQLTYFGDLGLYQLLTVLGQNPEAARFYRKTLGKLIQYDAEKNAELVPTLEGYFACHGNLSQTAARLHIHRNTLTYRLEQIAAITQLDLDDPDARFSLQLALKLRPVLR